MYSFINHGARTFFSGRGLHSYKGIVGLSVLKGGLQYSHMSIPSFLYRSFATYTATVRILFHIRFTRLRHQEEEELEFTQVCIYN